MAAVSFVRKRPDHITVEIGEWHWECTFLMMIRIEATRRGMPENTKECFGMLLS